MYLTDSDGITPLGYILVDSVPQDAVFPIIALAVKYGFDLLGSSKATGDGEEDPAKSFMMELFATGKMTLNLFKLI